MFTLSCYTFALLVFMFSPDRCTPSGVNFGWFEFIFLLRGIDSFSGLMLAGTLWFIFGSIIGGILGEKSKKIIKFMILVIIIEFIIIFGLFFLTSGFAGPSHPERPSLTGMEKAQQSSNLPTAYECSENIICFEFMASSLNEINYPANQSYMNLYLDGVPKELGIWNGGINGIACYNNPKKLSPGRTCYGKINATPRTCEEGAILALKIKHSWGAEKTVSVLCK